MQYGASKSTKSAVTRSIAEVGLEVFIGTEGAKVHDNEMGRYPGANT